MSWQRQWQLRRTRAQWALFCVIVCVLCLLAFHSTHTHTISDDVHPSLLSQSVSASPPSPSLRATERLLTEWWQSQAAIAQSLTYHIAHSIIALMANNHSQHSLCALYQSSADRPLYWDDRQKVYWSVDGASGQPFIIDELRAGDCRACTDSSQCPISYHAPQPRASNNRRLLNSDRDGGGWSPSFAVSIKPECQSVCKHRSKTHTSALNCAICQQSTFRRGSNAGVRLESLDGRMIDEPDVSMIDATMANLFIESFSQSFDSSSTFLAARPRVPVMLLQDVHTNFYQLARLFDSMLANPTDLQFAYRLQHSQGDSESDIAENEEALITKSKTLLPITPIIASSPFDPRRPYQVSHEYIKKFLSQLPHSYVAQSTLGGGGGGGAGFGVQVLCEHEGATAILVSSGGGGGGGFRLRPSQDVNGFVFAGGIGIGAGLQFNDELQPVDNDWTTALFDWTVGGGGGGGLKLRMSSTGAVEWQKEESGAASDTEITLPSSDKLSSLSVSLASKMRQCLAHDGSLTVSLGFGGGGGQQLLFGSTADPNDRFLARSFHSLGGAFNLVVDPCLLDTAAKNDRHQCARVRPFPIKIQSSVNHHPFDQRRSTARNDRRLVQSSAVSQRATTTASEFRNQSSDDFYVTGWRQLVTDCLQHSLAVFDARPMRPQLNFANNLWFDQLCPCIRSVINDRNDDMLWLPEFCSRPSRHKSHNHTN